MNSKSLLLIWILSAFVISITGCRKCVCCGTTSGVLTCIKGADTTNVYITSGPRKSIYDSINYYEALGFLVTANDTPSTGSGDLTAYCGKDAINQSKAWNLICETDIWGNGDCGM